MERCWQPPGAGWWGLEQGEGCVRTRGVRVAVEGVERRPRVSSLKKSLRGAGRPRLGQGAGQGRGSPGVGLGALQFRRCCTPYALCFDRG